MSALSSTFSSTFWYKDSLGSGSGKVELPLTENEPLGKSSGYTEKCELRIEGMTCGACVEVSFLSLSSPVPLDSKVFFKVYRGNAQITARNSFYKGRPAG